MNVALNTGNPGKALKACPPRPPDLVGRVSAPGATPFQSLLAFSLVEMIGVLAVMAVVVVLVVPATLRHLDLVAARQEMATLRALGDALQANIVHTDCINLPADWPSVLAVQAGMDITDVRQNARHHDRVFLVDAGGWLSTNLPYTQSHLGTRVVPGQARVMLVSSISRDLPISTGMPGAGEFDALWDAAAGTVPATGAWSGWTGRPEDVLIHRVNLSPLFVKLVLTTYISNTNGQYALSSSPTNQVWAGTPFTGYFLKGTVLKLYTGPTNSIPDATQVLNEDRSFVFEAGMWRDSILGRVTFGMGDVSGIVAAFLAATPNTNAINPWTNAQQVLVVQSMIDYLSNYNAWAAGSFSDGALHDYLLKTVQTNLLDAVRGLYSRGGQYDNYATNGTPCL